MTPYLAALLKGRAADDPLSLQFAPDARELRALPYESADPIGDDTFSPVEGIVHRYPDRVLLKVAHSCPVYCRFCFRREMVGRKLEAPQGGRNTIATSSCRRSEIFCARRLRKYISL